MNGTGAEWQRFCLKMMWKMDKCMGLLKNYVRVAAKYDPLLIGEVKEVQLTDINEMGLMGVEEA